MGRKAVRYPSLTAVTGVRIPYGTPGFMGEFMSPFRSERADRGTAASAGHSGKTNPTVTG